MRKLPIGDPLKKGTLVGPLIDARAYENMQRALDAARDEGGKITGGGRVHERRISQRAFT